MPSALKKISSTIISIIIWPIVGVTFIVIASIYLFAALFISPRKLYPLVRVLCRVFLISAGQRLKIEGKIPDPKDGPYLYLFNHQSMLDQFIVGAIVREYMAAVGAVYQFSMPIWGRLIKRYGVIPIDRKNLQDAIKSINAVQEDGRKGVSIFIAPEGTRTRTGKIGVFKKGPFHLALNTGITIMPIGLIGAFEAKNKDDWRIHPGRIRIKFGQPVPRDYYKKMSVEELRDDIKEKIAVLAEDELAVPKTLV